MRLMAVSCTPTSWTRSTSRGVLALRSISERCAGRIEDASRILEAQNEVLYAEERANAKPREKER